MLGYKLCGLFIKGQFTQHNAGAAEGLVKWCGNLVEPRPQILTTPLIKTVLEGHKEGCQRTVSMNCGGQ